MKSHLLGTVVIPDEASAPSRRLLRRKAAANYLGVSEQFLEKSACRRDGPVMIKASRRLVLYDTADLDAWLARKRVEAA